MSAFQAEIDWQRAKDDVFGEIMPNVRAIERAMARGMRAPAAMDYVLGVGAYEAFARQIWESCRAMP